ncbi:uncharacterized protein LOC6559617 [Drosophila grimshawi]|uniref:uncharacterized protein LOC6559617 n=1 Tax=Drosophila grimshawi TaxID=7222 RepID=UPI000C8715B7|nr:uncharacterized protein LOC6559617 [Drosophila grimshawi]
MKYFHQIIGILMGYGLCIRALVHYEKLEKGENGCKSKEGAEMKVGEVVDDPLTCGVFVCQNVDGDALIHYCQKPAPFENCLTDGVSTITPFPECCWKCVNYIECDAAAGNDAGGAGGGGDAGRAAAGLPPPGDAGGGDAAGGADAYFRAFADAADNQGRDANAGEGADDNLPPKT